MALTRIFCLFIIIIYSCSCQPDTSSTCQVWYTEQPPEQLQCNPYPNAELRLECTVVATLNQIPRLNWYRTRSIQQQQSQQIPWEDRSSSSSSSEQSRSKRQGGQVVTERLDATQPGVIIRQQYRSSGTESSLRSRLQLSSIDGFDSGEYWCSVEVNGVEQAQITPSDVVFLRDPAFYSQLGACATTGALSKLQRKCAVAASSSISVATASAQTTTLTPEGNDASTTAPVKPLAPTGGVKPTSSLPNTPDNSGVLGATTDGMSNPTINREISATTDESTQAVHNSVNGSATENDLVGDNPTDSDANTNPNVLLELYIAIAILVIFGVIIMILVPVTICMCLKKRKFRMIEGMRRARQNLELASARCNNVQPTTTQLHVASDYLVPQPSWRSHKKIEPVDWQSTDCLHQSYETMLSYSHEYEDVVDVIAREEGHTQLDVSVSVDSSPTSTVSSVLSEAEETSPRTDAHTYDSPMQMKRNEAYRLYRTVDGREYVRRHAYCNDVTVPVTNPLNSLYAQTEQSSNLE